MIKTTKKNIIPILKTRLKSYYVVKHTEGESYDSDLILWNRKKHFLYDNMTFIDLSSDYRHIIIRKKWQYDGISKMIREPWERYLRLGYYELNSDELDDRQQMSEIEENLNNVVHIINFMTRHNTKAVMYEIYEYMMGVLNEAEKVFKNKGII